MMKITTILKLGILGSLGALMACAKPAPSLVTENSVNLSRYVGTWYEQARLPNRFQKECVADTVAEYALNAQGQLHVVNQCQLMDGSTIVANGVGRVNRSVEPQDTANLQECVLLQPGLVFCRWFGGIIGLCVSRVTTTIRWWVHPIESICGYCLEQNRPIPVWWRPYCSLPRRKILILMPLFVNELNREASVMRA